MTAQTDTAAALPDHFTMPPTCLACTGKSDPVFALIAIAEAALARINGSPELSDEETELLMDGLRAVEMRLYCTVPATIAGLAALLGYLRRNEDPFANPRFHGDDGNLGWTLEAAARRLAGLPDPEA
jgi:hypothetical protein